MLDAWLCVCVQVQVQVYMMHKCETAAVAVPALEKQTLGKQGANDTNMKPPEIFLGGVPDWFFPTRQVSVADVEDTGAAAEMCCVRQALRSVPPPPSVYATKKKVYVCICVCAQWATYADSISRTLTQPLYGAN